MALAVAFVLVALALWAVRALPILVRLVRRVRRSHRLTAHIPGPPGLPVLGNLLQLVRDLRVTSNFVLECMDRYGPRFKLWIGPTELAVVVCDAEDLQVQLKLVTLNPVAAELLPHSPGTVEGLMPQVVMMSPHCTTKAEMFYSETLPILGSGLISLNGSVHRRHRKATTPSLHFDILKEFMPHFNHVVQDVVPHLDKLAESGEVFDVVPFMGLCSSQSICQTVLNSQKLPGKQDDNMALVKAMHRAGEVVVYAALRPWYRLRTIFSLLDRKTYREFQEAVKMMSEVANELVFRKTCQWNTSSKNEESHEKPLESRRTFVDEYFASPNKSKLDLEEVREEIKTILAVGSMTSMDFLANLLFIMSRLPAIQQKVQEELDELFSVDPWRDVVLDDLSRMPYLERVLKETLRWAPPAPLIARQAMKDIALPSGDIIPEGTFIGIPIPMVHRNPKYFPDPWTFDPDRFLPEQVQDRHPFAYIPFSAGARNCIGSRYAMMFVKTIAASILRRYDVLPDPKATWSMRDVPYIAGLSLSIEGGSKIRLRLRGRP